MLSLPLYPMHNIGDIVEYSGQEAVVIDMVPSHDGLDDFLLVFMVNNEELRSTLDSCVSILESPSETARKIALVLRLKGTVSQGTPLQRITTPPDVWMSHVIKQKVSSQAISG